MTRIRFGPPLRNRIVHTQSTMRGQIRLVATVLTLACLTASFAEPSTSMSDVLMHDKYPATLAAKDLSKDFKVFHFAMTGQGSTITDFFSSFFGALGGAFGSNDNNNKGAQFMKLLGTYWTTGETMNIDGKSFLVTYRLQLDVDAEKKGLNKDFPTDGTLSLSYIRTDTITSIEPVAGMNKDELLKLLALAKDDVHADATMSTAKQIGTAINLYLGDNDDLFPFVQGTSEMMQATRPYLPGGQEWKTADGKRLLFNMALSGVSLKDIPMPLTTTVVYQDVPSSDGKRVVVYVDGHAARLPESEWTSVKVSLGLKLPRTNTKPYGK